jgi:hypothetical protein
MLKKIETRQMLVEDYRVAIAEVLEPGEAIRIRELCKRLNWRPSGAPANKLKRILPSRSEWVAVTTERGLRQIRLRIIKPGAPGSVECKLATPCEG